MSASVIVHKDLLALEASCIPVAVYRLEDRRFEVRMVSDGFCDLFGFDTHEQAMAALDANHLHNVHPQDAARVTSAEHHLATEGGAYDVVYRTRDVAGKQWRLIHAQGRCVCAEDGARHAIVWYANEGEWRDEAQGNVGQASASASLDSVPQQRHQRHIGHCDALTGLPSTEYFFELANRNRVRLVREGKRVAVLFVNLMGMRLFNRKYGYAEGNELIRQVAHVLSRHFSSQSCAYLGQGCYGAITAADGLDHTLRALFGECRDLNSGKTTPLHVGVYACVDENVRISAALDRARTAGKTCAGNRFSVYCYFSDNMLEAEEEQQYIIDNLDTALEQGWVQIHCQPLVRAANGRVCDEEALARWIDPNKGFLSPARFIPVLEETRLIYKLDLYVLEQVLKKMAILKEKGLYIVPSSINLSRSDFEMCDIVEEIRRRVDKAGIDHDKIVVEITESTLGGGLDYIREQVNRFHELGFSVWMDDFGSEYSSLDNLQRVPFDLIKFDRGFMREFDKNEKSKVILTELVRMAIALGVDTVAEGVETKEQVEFLREIGCSKLQGFYFSKPNSLDEILRRYETGTAIGFENPAESEYFTALSKINLYDLASVARKDRESYSQYFDTVPMALVELDSNQCMITRCNGAYKDFLHKIADVSALSEWVSYPVGNQGTNNGFIHSLQKCAVEGGLAIVDDRVRNGVSVHAIIRRVATNPVTGVAAMAVAVLSIMDETEREGGVSFPHMARALAADYINLYYVDFNTDEYIEYQSNASVAELQVVQRGTDFFGRSLDEALARIYEDDREVFLEAFQKERIVRALSERGTYTKRYRIVDQEGPVYVNMKATRIAEGDGHVLFAISRRGRMNMPES